MKIFLYKMQEFLRRHGSTSRLCRKVRSADNLPLASSSHQDNEHRNSQDGSIEADREIFLPSTSQEDQDRTEDSDSKRQSSLESGTKDNIDVSLIEPYPQSAR